MNTLTEYLTATLAGVAVSTTIIQSIPGEVAPKLRDAISHQEATVRIYEENFPGERSAEVRRQWEESKAKAETQLEAFKRLPSVPFEQ